MVGALSPTINLFMKGIISMSTMKEVYEKIKTTATQALPLLEPVYEFYTKSDVTWSIGCIDGEDVENGIQLEIRNRKEQISKEYEETLLEFEKEINDQFKDVCDSVEYFVDYDRDKSSFSWVEIKINDFITSIEYSKYSGLNVFDGYFPPYDKIRGLDVERSMSTGGVFAAVKTLREIYNALVSQEKK